MPANSDHYFIAGDWGTSNLRLFLCQAQRDQPPTLLDTQTGKGIRAVSKDFESYFFSLANKWLDRHPTVPVILSGMAGANIGWREVPYQSCPLATEKIAGSCLQFQARNTQIHILSGLQTRNNPLSQPDVMRGEDLQILGWSQMQAESSNGRHLLALPGTHNKWVMVDNGVVESFFTAFTGELFDILKQHSILLANQSASSWSNEAFIRGAEAVSNAKNAQLIHTLFAVRSRQINSDLLAVDAASFLSGQLIAADVMGARALLDDFKFVTIIADAKLAQLYQRVIEHVGCSAECLDPNTVALSGYQAIYQSLYGAQH